MRHAIPGQGSTLLDVLEFARFAPFARYGSDLEHADAARDERVRVEHLEEGRRVNEGPRGATAASRMPRRPSKLATT